MNSQGDEYMKYVCGVLLICCVMFGSGCGQSERLDQLEKENKTSYDNLRKEIEKNRNQNATLKTEVHESLEKIRTDLNELEKTNQKLAEQRKEAEKKRKRLIELLWTDTIDRDVFNKWKSGLDVPAVRVNRSPESITVDGTLDKAYRNLADPLPFYSIQNLSPDRKPDKNVNAYLLMGPEHFYIAVIIRTPSPVLNSSKQKRDSALWKGEYIDIFIEPSGGENLYTYYQIATDSAGSLFDSRGGDSTWNPEIKVACSLIESKAWIMEMAVPLKALGVNPKQINKVWSFNIEYFMPGSTDDQVFDKVPDLDIIWSPTGSDKSNVPDRFGYLWFPFAGRPDPKILKQ